MFHLRRFTSIYFSDEFLTDLVSFCLNANFELMNSQLCVISWVQTCFSCIAKKERPFNFWSKSNLWYFVNSRLDKVAHLNLLFHYQTEFLFFKQSDYLSSLFCQNAFLAEDISYKVCLCILCFIKFQFNFKLTNTLDVNLNYWKIV